eukprot:3558621-Pyramimonas_sp.AAC.1
MLRSGDLSVRRGRLGAILVRGSREDPVKLRVGSWAASPIALVQIALCGRMFPLFFLCLLLGRRRCRWSRYQGSDATELLVDYGGSLMVGQEAYLQRQADGPGRPCFDAVLRSDGAAYTWTF